MTLSAAPLYNDVAEGPASGRAYWLPTTDGVKIRIGVWPKDGAKGTVMIFPGRTEYVEKYGRAAADYAARGFASIAVDWRGQGIADRLSDTQRLGHVGRFTDYQKDVAAVMEAMAVLNMPRPWFLMAHSMGGCIGLRALYDGLDVEACAFSAPMWGVQISPALRPVAWTLSTVLPPLGLGLLKSPGANDSIYVLDDPFEDNTLTNDQGMWEYMGTHARSQPGMTLGAPSIIWLREALFEMRGLAARPSPDYPCVCFLGTNERIVDPGRIKSRMAAWPGAELIEFDQAEHEVMMEEPAIRQRVFDRTAALFDSKIAKAA